MLWKYMIILPSLVRSLLSPASHGNKPRNLFTFAWIWLGRKYLEGANYSPYQTTLRMFLLPSSSTLPPHPRVTLAFSLQKCLSLNSKVFFCFLPSCILFRSFVAVVETHDNETLQRIILLIHQDEDLTKIFKPFLIWLNRDGDGMKLFCLDFRFNKAL